MKSNEIEVNGRYYAKVSNRVVIVKVVSIDEGEDPFSRKPRTTYRVKNTATGRYLTFKSAARFRKPAAAKSVRMTGTVPKCSTCGADVPVTRYGTNTCSNCDDGPRSLKSLLQF